MIAYDYLFIYASSALGLDSSKLSLTLEERARLTEPLEHGQNSLCLAVCSKVLTCSTDFPLERVIRQGGMSVGLGSSVPRLSIFSASQSMLSSIQFPAPFVFFLNSFSPYFAEKE